MDKWKDAKFLKCMLIDLGWMDTDGNVDWEKVYDVRQELDPEDEDDLSDAEIDEMFPPMSRDEIVNKLGILKEQAQKNLSEKNK